MNTITIDCGASFVKAALACEGKLIKTIEKKSPIVHQEESILLPLQIEALVTVVKEVIEELVKEISEVNLCISNEMHGFIIADENGAPITDYISWQKEYGKICISGRDSYELLLNADELAQDVFQTGMPLRAGLPSANLFYLFRNGLISPTKKYRFYTLGGYLIRRIFDVDGFEHDSNAAATGLYDLKTKEWNCRIIDFIGAGNVEFPKIADDIIECEYHDIHFYIFPPIGDQQAALLGAGIESFEDISFNLGTGAQISILTDKIELSKEYQIRPFFQGKYIKTIPHIPSGRALNVFFRFVNSVLQSFDFDIEDNAIWDKISSSVNYDITSKLSVDLSFFGNPITNSTVGTIENIGEYDLSFDEMFKAVFSRLISNYLLIAHRIQPNRDKVKRIIFSGGIARRFEVIRERLIAEYSQADVIVAKNETLLGLLRYSQMLIKDKSDEN